MSLIDNSRDRCECGHMQKNHRSISKSTYGGRRYYMGCRYCDCPLFTLKEVFMGEKDGELIFKPYEFYEKR